MNGGLDQPCFVHHFTSAPHSIHPLSICLLGPLIHPASSKLRHTHHSLVGTQLDLKSVKPYKGKDATINLCDIFHSIP